MNVRNLGKLFIYSASLRNHERIHTGEKPYKCKKYEKAFFSAKCLREHKVTHGKMPHECKECGKAFLHSSLLRNHEKFHTWEKPSECNHSGKIFSCPRSFAIMKELIVRENPMNVRNLLKLSLKFPLIS